MPRVALVALPSAPIILLIMLLHSWVMLASIHQPLPHAGLVALGLLLALLSPTWPALPGSVSSSLGPLGTLSDWREAHSSSFPLLLCLPAPPQSRLWGPLNWS